MILRQSVDLVLTKNIFNIVLKDYLDRLSVNKTNNYKWYGIVVAVNLLDDYNNTKIFINNRKLHIIRKK